jgi:N-sulfoglucosamine sulfohydrolase
MTLLTRIARLLAGAALAAAGLAAEGVAADPPNILFCVADDWGWPHAGAYGCGWVKTPGFDRVAREGLLFANAYTPNAKCAPSRATILTGRNPWQLEEACNHICRFPAKFTTYMEALGRDGYSTGMTGKGWGPGDPGRVGGKPRDLTGKPFQARTLRPATSGILPRDYEANFRDFLDARPAGKPWCFWYGGHEPHRGYEAGSGRAKGGKKLSDVDVPSYWPDTDAVRDDLLDYALEVEHFDAQLTKMLALLEERGELENTMVVVTSDNGMPFPRVKGQPYETATHLPLAVLWRKGIRDPGRVVREPVSFIDFAPTFIEAAGLDWKRTGMEPSPGRSLSDVFEGKAVGRDRVLLGQERHDVGRPRDEGYPVRGIVRDGLLYLHNFEPSRWPACDPETGYLNCDGGPTKTAVLEERRREGRSRAWDLCFGKRGAEELYDVRSDPSCVKNLAGERAEAKAALKEALFRELREQGDPRVLGHGHVFDEYPYAQEDTRNFYERYRRGENVKAAWVNPGDFEKKPLDQ